MKERVIDAGFAFFKATGLHARLAPWTRGQGAILTLHHVRPWVERDFAPNRLLEIEPAFLDAALGRIRALGYDLVSMDEVLRRLARAGGPALRGVHLRRWLPRPARPRPADPRAT